MHVPEIIEVKDHLEKLKEEGLLKEWELPYENILTRLTAAIFFLTPADDSKMDEVWKRVEEADKVGGRLAYRLNEEKKLSQMVWRIEFNKGFEL
ncbi:MAG: hypothetical protein GY940_06485 [bacterium]|nr:hypothetical protein [bacterium]